MLTSNLVCLFCGLMSFFICVSQENSEDDKKRGRSTDSEVSQVRLKTLKVTDRFNTTSAKQKATVTSVIKATSQQED